MKHFLAFFVLIWLLAKPSSVHACSGGTIPAEINDMVSMSDLVVTGRFAELDTLQLNGIFHVDSYLVGSGDEYILLALNNNYTLFSRLTMERGLSGDCGGSYSLPYSPDADYIFFLNERMDGAFAPIFYPIRAFAEIARPYYEFSSDDPLERLTIETIDRDNNRSFEIYEWDFKQIRDYITAQTGIEPSPPDRSQSYPRKRTLLLSIAAPNGDRSYALVPVDNSRPVRIDEASRLSLMRDIHACDTPPCTIFSYQGVDSVQLSATEDAVTDPTVHAEYNYRVTGQRIIASPTNDTFAVWQPDRIVIYGVTYRSRGFYSSTSELIETTTTQVSQTSLHYPARWSPNGRFLAYSDDTNLYIWDVFTPGAHPSPVLSNTTSYVPIVRYFSPMGRYLAVTEGENKFTYDLVSGLRLPDGIVSPDDRSLLVLDTTVTAQQDILLQRFVPFSEPITVIENAYGVQWINNDQILLTACGRGYHTADERYIDKNWCRLQAVDTTWFWTQHNYHYVEGTSLQILYDYDEIYGKIAVVENAKRLFIDGIEIDLSEFLNPGESIIGANWMPNLFFESE